MSDDTGKEDPTKRQPPDDTEPLPADKARNFIKDEITKDLKQRAIWFFSIFGVANLLAFVGVWVSVQSAAKDAATTEAKQSVEGITKTIADTASDSLKKFVTSLTELEGKKAELKSQIDTGAKDLQNLKDGISAEQNRMKSLNDNISADTTLLAAANQNLVNINGRFDALNELATRLEKFKDIPDTKLRDVIGALNDDAKALVPKLDQIFSELQNVYTYGIKVVDSNIAAAALGSAQVQIENIMRSAGKNSQDSILPATQTQLIDPSQSSTKFQLPKGSGVLATWGIPYGGKSDQKYAVTVDPSDTTKIEVLFSIKEADQGDIRVYILYRTPLHAEINK
jgi:hypothetical protein